LWTASPAETAALCGVPLTAVHGVNDTNQSISFDQNLASAINSNPACGNSFTLVPIQGAGHGTWSGPSGYQAGTGAGTPLARIASDLRSTHATIATASAAKAPVAAAGAAPGAVAAPAATSAESPPTPSAASSNTALSIETATIRPGGGSIADSDEHVWTITASGSIMEDGQYTPGGGGTSALTIGADGTIYGQDNGHDGNTVNPGGWFALSGNGQSWQVSAAPPSGATTVTTAAAPTLATAAATTPAIAVPTVCGSGIPSGAFKTVNGRIVGPDGKDWIARGINAYDSLLDQGPAMTAMFPGLNFIRVGVHQLQDPSAYAGFISHMTAQGRVVELEHHPDGGGGQDAPYQGGQLAAESAWYASVAAAFKNNPYVWFGTFNEPGTSPGSLSAWHKATYDAIRGTGNNNPILIEPGGSRPWNLVQSLDPSVYTSMTNIIMDPHIYGYQTNGSTDQATNDANVAAMIAAAQTIKSADGTPAVMIAEYGDSTDGTNTDGNGEQNVTAVVNAGGSGKAGSAAWAWLPGGNADHLQNSGVLTSPYGQIVALYINTDVVPCSAAEATANAQNQLATITAQLAATPAPGQSAPATPDSVSPTATDPAIATLNQQADASIAQANAIISAAQAQIQTPPAASP
jgi:hypothetical protein